MSKLLGSGSGTVDAKRGNNEEIVVPKKEETFFDSKIFRFLTVGIYLAAVSGMGMMISFYHLFFWDSRKPQLPPNREG